MPRATLRRAVGWIFLALLASAPLSAQGTLATDDGLSISLWAGGAVSSLSLDGLEYASESLPSGFAYRELGAPLDLAPNGSLEAGSSRPSGWTWTNNGNGSWTWDSTVAAEGSRSLRVDVPGSVEKRSPMLNSDSFPIRPNTPYTFRYRVRTQGVSSVLNFFLVEKDSAGNLLQRGLASNSGTNDWQTETMTFVSGPRAASASFKVEIFSGYGTAWIDDVRMLDLYGGRSAQPFGGAVTSDTDGLHQAVSTDGLQLEVRYSNAGPAIRVDATLTDTDGRDRAIELSFVLPLDAVGWNWEQGPLASLPITDGVRYENLDESFGAQSHSNYPFATVRSPTAAFSLATPMVPQMNRFRYFRPGGFRLTWDLGLSAAATKTPSRADVTFWIYTQDPRWGLRATVEKYRTLNPGAFASSVDPASGAWVIPLTGDSIETVPSFADFGWAFVEGLGDIDYANENGLSVFHYVDASGYFRAFPDYTSQPSYDVLVAALESDAAHGGNDLTDAVPRAEMAQATINSSPHDPSGRYQLFANSYFWYGNRLQIYPVSPDADIPEPNMFSIRTRYSVDGRIAWAAARGSRIDGFFVDDVTSTFATVENHRRDLWAYSDFPLTFSWETGQVMLLDGFSMAEFCGSFRSYVHDRNLVLMGSMNAGMYAWFAPYFDVLGGETGGAEGLDRAYVRRVLGDGRAWSNLLVTGSSAAPDAGEVLGYLRQALLLGFFPGFNGAYWSHPEAYERDRSLFRQYIPLIRTVVQAGWRPVNGTTASDSSIAVERFDGGRGGVFFLTAQNTGGTARSVRFELDLATLSIEEGTAQIRELVRDRTMSVSRTGDALAFTDTLLPGETFLYRVDAPRSVPERRPTHRVRTRD